MNEKQKAIPPGIIEKAVEAIKKLPRATASDAAATKRSKQLYLAATKPVAEALKYVSQKRLAALAGRHWYTVFTVSKVLHYVENHSQKEWEMISMTTLAKQPKKTPTKACSKKNTATAPRSTSVATRATTLLEKLRLERDELSGMLRGIQEKIDLLEYVLQGKEEAAFDPDKKFVEDNPHPTDKLIRAV
jgi:hypothetical protein